MSYADAVADFISAMEIEGIRPVEPIAQRLSGCDLIRFRCDGDGKGRQNGWAIIYLDERPNGAFGNYRMGLSRKWRSGNHVALSPAERAALQREWAEAKERRRQERETSETEAALDAVDMWTSAGPARSDHGYIARKGMNPTLFRQAGSKLLFPMYDHEGRLWNLQRVDADGSKRFLKGGRVDGLFLLLGDASPRGVTLCLGEGVATMEAVHAATGFPCVATFSAKNMPTVARLWWSARRDMDFVICADDDPELIDNPNIRQNLGLVTARAIADEIGARLAVPNREAA